MHRLSFYNRTYLNFPNGICKQPPKRAHESTHLRFTPDL